MGSTQTKALAALRIVLGFGFLYAGLEKIFDFGGSGKAFTAAGFLQNGTAGSWPGAIPKSIVNPTHDLWVSLGTNGQLMPILNWLVVAGETAVGIALVLGLATRFAGVMGAILITFITIAAWNFGNGLINETVLYAVVALYLAAANAGHAYGLDGYLDKTEFVTRTRGVHYLTS